jgi:hypothetical protein
MKKQATEYANVIESGLEIGDKSGWRACESLQLEDRGLFHCILSKYAHGLG